jgi:serine/threonine protein kinase
MGYNQSRNYDIKLPFKKTRRSGSKNSYGGKTRKKRNIGATHVIMTNIESWAPHSENMNESVRNKKSLHQRITPIHFGGESKKTQSHHDDDDDDNMTLIEFIGEGGFGCAFRPMLSITASSKLNISLSSSSSTSKSIIPNEEITKLMSFHDFQKVKPILDIIRKADPTQKYTLTYIDFEKITFKQLKTYVESKHLTPIMKKCTKYVNYEKDNKDERELALIHMTDGGVSFNRIYISAFKITQMNFVNPRRLFSQMWNGIFNMIKGYADIFMNRGIYHFDIKPHNILINSDVENSQPFNIRLFDYDLAVNYNVLAERADLLTTNNLNEGIKSFTEYFMKTLRANYIFYPSDLYILYGLVPSIFRKSELLTAEVLAGLYTQGVIKSAFHEYVDEKGVASKIIRIKKGSDYFLGEKIMRVLEGMKGDVKKDCELREKITKRLVTFISNCIKDEYIRDKVDKWIANFVNEKSHNDKMKYIMRTIMEKTDVFGFSLFMMNMISRFTAKGTNFPLEIAKNNNSLNVSQTE